MMIDETAMSLAITVGNIGTLTIPWNKNLTEEDIDEVKAKAIIALGDAKTSPVD